MALVKCGACQANIAKDVKFCPECGQENSHESQKRQKSSGLAGDAQVIIDAVNSNTDSQVRDLKNDINNLGKEVEGVRNNVKALDARVVTTNDRLDRQGERQDRLEAELNMLKEGKVALATLGCSGRDQRTSVPRNMRCSIVVWAFEYDTDKSEIENTLSEIVKPCKDDVDEHFCPSKFCGSMGIVVFKTNKLMWKFLKANKGHRFKHGEKTLRHGIELSKNELTLGKKVSVAASALREAIVSQNKCSEEDAPKWVDGNWESGVVTFRDGGKGKGKKMFEKKVGELELTVGSDASDIDLGFDFDFEGKPPDINKAP